MQEIIREIMSMSHFLCVFSNADKEECEIYYNERYTNIINNVDCISYFTLFITQLCCEGDFNVIGYEKI